MLDIPIAGELVPADLHRPGDQVGLVNRLAGRFLSFTPFPEQGHAPSMAASLEPVVECTQRVLGIGRIPQAGEHMHTARFQFGRLWILVLIDHVLVNSQVRDVVDFRLQPGLAETSPGFVGSCHPASTHPE